MVFTFYYLFKKQILELNNHWISVRQLLLKIVQLSPLLINVAHVLVDIILTKQV